MPPDQHGPEAPDPCANRLVAALPEADRQRLIAQSKVVELAVRDPLYEPDVLIEHVYFPLTTVISMLAVMDDGQSVEVATIGNEGVVGLPLFLGASSSPGLAFCQIPGQALRTQAGRFRELANSAGSLHGLLQRYTYAFFMQVAQGSACNQLHSVDQRCARWLLLTHDRVVGRPGGPDEFLLTQQFLAQMLGVRRATVTEAAGRLQRAGLIRYRRGVITIVDRQGLEAASCECYRIVSDEYTRLIG